MTARHRFLLVLLTASLLGGVLSLRQAQRRAAGEPSSTAAGEKNISHQPSPGTADPVVKTPDQWETRWQRLRAEPRGTVRDEDLVTFFEELAALDPLRALSLAAKESDPDLRREFLEAALRGWGATHPEAALAWADSQDLLDSGEAMAAVFHGAARDPENAVRLATRLSESNPARAHDYGSCLVAALSRAGEFESAAVFAAKGAPEDRVDWLNTAYSRWAGSEPRTAAEHAGQRIDPEIRRASFDAAVSRWATDDPKAAASFALGLSDDRERSFALAAALRAWSTSDTLEAAQWLNGLEPSRDLDFGVAMVAAQRETLIQPKVAAGWAATIHDPKLRVRVLALVVNEWAGTDPAAARRYAETSPELRPEDRAGVLATFEPGFNPISLLP